MSTLQQDHSSTNELGPSGRDKGTYCRILNDEKCKKKKKSSNASSTEVDQSNGGKAKPKKKRKKSILEELNLNCGDKRIVGVARSVDRTMKGKENSKIPANANNTDKVKKGPKMKTTLRDFYSLSHKQDSQSSPDSMVAENTSKRSKRRNTGNFIPLNEHARPIHVHIPFSGQDKHSSITIESHCVGNKFDLGDEPLVLTGKYHRRSKIQIERFLSGFGRYIQ